MSRDLAIKVGALAKWKRDDLIACACAVWASLCYAGYFLFLAHVSPPVTKADVCVMLVMFTGPFVALFGLAASALGLWLNHGNRRLLLISLFVNAAAAAPLLVSGVRYQLSRFS